MDTREQKKLERAANKEAEKLRKQMLALSNNVVMQFVRVEVTIKMRGVSIEEFNTIKELSQNSDDGIFWASSFCIGDSYPLSLGFKPFEVPVMPGVIRGCHVIIRRILPSGRTSDLVFQPNTLHYRGETLDIVELLKRAFITAIASNFERKKAGREILYKQFRSLFSELNCNTPSFFRGKRR